MLDQVSKVKIPRFYAEKIRQITISQEAVALIRLLEKALMARKKQDTSTLQIKCISYYLQLILIFFDSLMISILSHHPSLNVPEIT